jgi:O-antigen/teichoic acid export membrane protein
VVTAFGGLNSALSYFLLNRRPGAAILKPALITAAAYIAVGALALLPITLFSGHRNTLLAALLFLPPSAVINLAMGYAVGVKRVRYFTSVNFAVTVLNLVLMSIGLFLVAREPSVAIAAWLIANWTIALVAAVAVFRHSRTLEGDQAVSSREFMRFAVKVGLVNLVSLLNYRADVYIVAILATPADLGLYTVAIAAAESLLVPTQVAALVTSPHIGALQAEAAARLAARCVRNNLLVALVVCGVLFVFAHPLIALLYGRAFLPVVPALRILLAGVFTLSLGSPMSTYFTLKLGRPEVPLRLAAISAAVCIAVAIFLLPRWGITGAALGSTAGYAIGQAAAFWYFGRTTRLGLSAMLMPTRGDLALYWSFLLRVLRDGRRLLPPMTSAR